MSSRRCGGLVVLLGIAAMVIWLFWNTGKKVDNEPNYQEMKLAGQIQQSQKGDFIILTNGEIYAVVQVLDTNNVMLAYGRGDWVRGEIKYFAERSHAVIAENSSDAMRVKTAFYDQVVGRTNDPIRLHP